MGRIMKGHFVQWINQRRVAGAMWKKYRIRPIELQCLVTAALYLMLKGKRSGQAIQFVKFYSRSRSQRHLDNRLGFYESLVEKGFMTIWIHKATQGRSFAITPLGFKVLEDVEIEQAENERYYKENAELYKLEQLKDLVSNTGPIEGRFIVTSTQTPEFTA